MKKRNLLTVAILAAWLVILPQRSPDTIKWSPVRKLTLQDYKGKPDPSSKFKAVSYLVRPTDWIFRNDSIYVSLSTFFRPSASWFIRDPASSANEDQLLVHEQGHFDLDEIEIRKARKRFLKNQQTITKYNYKRVVEQYLSDIEYFLEQRHRQYDLETDFSLNRREQKIWNEKIAAELQSLEAYREERMAFPVRR
jgi:hypothetical protein